MQLFRPLHPITVNAFLMIKNIQMQPKYLFLITGLVISLSLSAQNFNMDFKKQWTEIDSLIVIKNLPKTALQKVDILYEKATKQQLHAQIIKALLYKMSLTDQVNEQDINKNMASFQDEIRKAIAPAQKSILQCLQAQQLYQYYNNNRHRLYQRSKTINFKKEDIATWSHDDFHKAITALYHEALKPALTLQQTPLPPYNAIIIKGNVRELRPTLYDLLGAYSIGLFQIGRLLCYQTNVCICNKRGSRIGKSD